MDKHCTICGMKYASESNNAKYCPNCRKKVKKNYNKPYLDKPKRKSLAKTKSLNEIVIEMEEYNQKNGTRLTYGKYVSMINF